MVNKKNSVSVEKAIYKGKLILVYLPLIIIFLVIITSIFIIDAYDLSKWFFVVSFLLAISLGWLQWSFCVIKWKIWAYKNVRNVHELYRKAIEFKLIWEDGSFYNKTQIISRKERKELHYLEKKFEVADEYFDDLTVPEEIKIFYSRGVLTFFLIFGLVVLFLGIFVIDKPKSYLCYLTSILLLYQFYKKRKIGCYLKINSDGISHKEILYRWENILSASVVFKYNEKKNYLIISFYENFRSEELNLEEENLEEEFEIVDMFKIIEIDINDLSKNPFEIERIVQVFKIRFQNKL